MKITTGRQALDEEVMRTRQERNSYQEQAASLTDAKNANDQDISKNIKSQTELMRHLNELENMNSELDKENQELRGQIKQLQNQDDRAREFEDMQMEIDDLAGKLDQAEQDLDEFQKENHYLKTALEEKTVQLEAANRFEEEYDAQVSSSYRFAAPHFNY